MKLATKIQANAYILIGGSSRRFGSPKWAAELNQVRLIDHIWNECERFQTCHVIGKTLTEKIDYPFIKDEIHEIQSPLNGLYTALMNTNKDWNFIISCDLPLITKDIIQRIWNNGNKTADAIVPLVDLQKHPLCAFYNRKIVLQIKEEILNNKLKVMDILKLIQTDYVDIKKNKNQFFNMNTKRDLEKISLH